ncbi:MAG: hypothetical protein GEU98_18710 [Pseudonocardiaceae bacterium]|nr:hypothetical protein [Pseudonocardiaceae bacterium]
MEGKQSRSAKREVIAANGSAASHHPVYTRCEGCGRTVEVHEKIVALVVDSSAVHPSDPSQDG